MPPAVIAGVGLAAGGIGAAVSASSNKKAATTAANAATQTANSNNALSREIYGQNKETLNPYIQNGYAAGNALNSMLGLGSSTATPSTPAPTPAAMPAASGTNALTGVDSGWLNLLNSVREKNGLAAYANTGPQPVAAPAAAAPATTQANPISGNDAFKQYIANSDYGFQFGEGSNAVNSGYAGAGTLQSGAAMKALEEYRQGLQSGYRNEYMGYLGNQQGVGLGAASALAGVGQNYVSNVSANNNNAASATANAALVKAQNNPLANSLGLLGGGMYGLGLNGIKF